MTVKATAHYTITDVRDGRDISTITIDPSRDTLFHFDENLLSTQGLEPIGTPVATLHPRGGKFGGAVAVEEATTNLFANPSFTDSLTGWGLVRHPAGEFHPDDMALWNSGQLKLQKRPGANSQIFVSQIVNIPTTGIWTFSAYVTCDTPNAAILDVNDGTAWRSIRHSGSGKRERLQIQLDLPVGNRSFRLGVYHSGTVDAWFDDVQIEFKPFATSFVDGSRGAGQLRYPPTVTRYKDITVSLWANPRALSGGHQCVFSLAETTSKRFNFFLRSSHTNQVAAWDLVNGWYFSGFPLPTSDRYYMLTFVVNMQGAVSIYVDGDHKGTSPNRDFTLTPAEMGIGSVAFDQHASEFSNAIIDEVLILPYAATAEEIKTWYDLQLPFFDPKDIAFKGKDGAPGEKGDTGDKGDKGDPGDSAKYVIITGEQVFKYPQDGSTPTPENIILTASVYGGLTGYSWQYWTGSVWANLSGTQNAQIYTLAHNNTAWGTNNTLRVRCLSGGFFDEITIVKVQDGVNGVDGRDGTNGVNGTNGSDGLPAVLGLLSNHAHAVPAANDGVVSSYIGSGGTIQVWEGSTPLTFHTSLANGRFIVGTPVVNPSGHITPGARTGSGSTVCTIANHSAMNNATDVVTISYPITIRRINGGTDITFTLIQTITKARQGAQGPQGIQGNPGPPGQDANLLDWVSAWNSGKTLVKGDSIVTPKLFAGNNAGTSENPDLTGVAMGDVLKDGFNGVAGYRQNKRVFYLDTATGLMHALGGRFSGHVKLGGADDLSGALEVYNAQGDLIVDINAARGGIERLHVGHISGDNVVTKNDGESDYTIYVNGLTGDDDGAGTQASPYSTINRAIRDLPILNNITVTIDVANATYDENIAIQGYIGGGRYIFNFNNATLRGHMFIYACICRVDINALRISLPADHALTYAVFIQNSIGVEFNGCYLFCQSRAAYGFNISRSFPIVMNCEILGATNSAIFASNGSTVELRNNKGTAPYGVTSARAIVTGFGTQPTGSTANTLSQHGGQFFATFTYATSPEPVPPAPTQRTVYWNCTKTKVFTPGTGWGWEADDGPMRIGKQAVPPWWEGTEPGLSKSLIFFSDSSIRSILSGKTPSRIRVRIQRRSSGGNSGPVPVIFHLHNLTSPPAGDPSIDNSSGVLANMSWGDTRWITLPISYATRLRDNLSKGLALYTANTDPAHYGIFAGMAEFNVQLEITYT